MPQLKPESFRSRKNTSPSVAAMVAPHEGLGLRWQRCRYRELSRRGDHGSGYGSRHSVGAK